MANTPEQGIISTKQLIWLLFIIITSFTALQVPGLLVHQAGRDAWLSVIGAWFLDTLLAVVIAYLAVRFPGENYVQYGPAILGKALGKVFGLLFIGFFLLVSAVVMHGLGMYISDVFLSKTPPAIVLLGAYLVIAYIVRKGIEVIARICEMLGPLFLLSLVVLILMALPFAHFDRLKPQFDQGVFPFLGGVPLILSFVGICIAMSWYIPLCNRPENGFLAKFTALSLGSLIVGLIVVLSIGIFGAEQVGNTTNPGLELARMIRMDGYFERIEVIWLVIAVMAGIMMAVSAVWIVSLSVAQMAGFDTYKPFVYPVALLSFMLSLNSFPNNTAYLNFLYYAFPILGLLVETLPLWLLAIALIRGKKGAKA